MASQDAALSQPESGTHTEALPSSAVSGVVETVAKGASPDAAEDVDKKNTESPSRPLYVYTRHDLLHLSKSPMIVVPADIPVLKDWFGCVVGTWSVSCLSTW